jgi:muramoyltetrapeptide carboxypeptidase
MARKVKIAIVAPSSRLEPAMTERVAALAAERYPAAELHVHPQCYLSAGHFAGPDEVRAAAFVEVANDPSFDAVWFGRGGYGSARMAAIALPKLAESARRKTYLGYSDAGALLAGLYAKGFPGLAHGPMPADINRAGGEAAVARSLAYLVGRAP